MSLTSVLNDPERGNLKKWFRYHFPNPGLANKMVMAVPPSSTESSSSEIGIALDYLIRFNLERVNGPLFHGSTWIAEWGYECTLNEIDSTQGDRICIGHSVLKLTDKLELRRLVTSEFSRAKGNYAKFIAEGELTKSLLRSSIFLAKLEATYRTGRIVGNIGSIDSHAVAELSRLFTIVPWEKFRAVQRCVANPIFDSRLSLVGGADADFIVDDLLVDIKCTRKPGLNRATLNQLLGYTFLSMLEGVNGRKKPEIRRIGVYFARYGHLFTMPLADFCDRKQLKVLSKEFVRLVNNKRLKLLPRASGKQKL